MFIQHFQNGKIYKWGNIYRLEIDGLTFEDTSIQKVLERYSDITHVSLSLLKKGDW